MKTSNILLIALLAVTLLFGMGSNLVLKNEFGKINKDGLYAGFRKEPLRPFKYISLGGNAYGYTEIRPGKEFEIRTTLNPKLLEWKVAGDTLKITYKKNRNDEGYNYPNPYWGAPAVYILAPEVSYIESQNVITKVSDWNSKNLRINQQGQQMLLLNNTIHQFSAEIDHQGFLQIDRKNSIYNANVSVSDSSTFATENVFKSFRMQVDSAAKVSVPGSLLTNGAVE